MAPGYVESRPVSPPTSAAEELHQATGLWPAHVFAGNSLTDPVGGVVLAPTGAALHDQLVTNVLPGPVMASDMPSELATHTYKYGATIDSHDAPSPTSVDIDEQSVAVIVTFRVDPQLDIRGMTGNSDGVSGIELLWDSVNHRVDVRATPLGQASAFKTKDVDLDDGEWHTLVVIANRASNLLWVGAVDWEMSTALASGGSLTSTAPWSLGSGRVPGPIGAEIMHTIIAYGPQVEGWSPLPLAQAVAAQVWWAQDNSVIQTGAK